MEYKFKIGDRVKWNSDAAHVSGNIIKKALQKAESMIVLLFDPPNIKVEPYK